MRLERPSTPLRVLQLATALVLCSLAPACSSPGIPNSEESISLPLRLYAESVPLVQVRVGELEPQWFIVDTGSSVNVVSSDLAEKLNSLEWVESDVRFVDSSNQATSIRRHTRVGITLGNRVYRQVPVSAVDLRILTQLCGFEIGGILGLVFFKDSPVTIDYVNQELLLECAPLQEDMEGVLSLTLSERLRNPLVPVRIEGQSFTAFLDTGSAAGLDLPDALIQRLELSEPMVEVGKSIVLSGVIDERAGRLAGDLALGDHVVKGPVFRLAKHQAYLGGQILREFALTIDVQRRLVRFTRASKAPIELPAVLSHGVGFLQREGEWIVGYVLEGVPTVRRIESGDRIVLVNGRAARELEAGWHRTVQRETLTLVLERGDDRFQVVLPAVTLVP